MFPLFTVVLRGWSYLIIEVNLDRVKEFVKKYEDLQWERLSGEEREKIELESPMELDFTANLTLNGRKLQNDRGCGDSWIPMGLLKEEQAGILGREEILRHYGMDLSNAYLIQRTFYLWATKRKPKIRTLELELVPSPRTVPGIHFKAEKPGQKVTFVHPVTGTEHTITIRDWGWQQIPVEEKESQWVYPTHCAVLEYEIAPWLWPEEAAVLDRKEGDRPYLKNKDPKAPVSLGASSVAIIGGGRGRCQGRDQTCCASSSFYFKPQKEIEWRVLFRILDREKLEMKLYCNSSAM